MAFSFRHGQGNRCRSIPRNPCLLNIDIFRDSKVTSDDDRVLNLLTIHDSINCMTQFIHAAHFIDRRGCRQYEYNTHHQNRKHRHTEMPQPFFFMGM